MNSEQKIGVIRELENLPSMSKADGVFNVEDFRKSLLAEKKPAKILQFPNPVVEVSPSQVAELEQYGTAAEQMNGSLDEIDRRPEWLRNFSAPDYATYQSFPSLSQMQCECEDCECKEHPTNFVETHYASFKLCETCTDDCAKNVDKVTDLEALSDEELCKDWELRR